MTAFAFLLIFGWAGARAASAEDETLTEILKKFLNQGAPNFTKSVKAEVLEVTPIKIVDVKGDKAKYRAFNWTNDGTQWGINDLLMKGNSGKDLQVSFEGRANPENADYAGDMLATKGDKGYFRINYKTFRKYFENAGGYFPFPSSDMRQHFLGDNLDLDIGHFAMEIGRGPVKDPSLSLGWERDTKQGLKSTLNWAYAKDSAFGTASSNQRKITPSFYNIDNVTDTVKLKGKTDVQGFTVKGEQKFSFFVGKTLKQEQLYSNANPVTNSANKILQVIAKPQTKDLSTSVRAERWTKDDKSYVSFGYRYGHLRNSEFEAEREYTGLANFSPAGFLSGGTFKNGFAENDVDTHTWTGQAFTNLTNDLIFISRLKGELKDIKSGSHDFTLNSSEVITGDVMQHNKNQITSTAESFSLRYKGLAKTSLYSDLELKQERNWKIQDVTPATYSETVNRRPEGTATIGMRYVLNSKLNLTTELKHGQKNDKLDQVKGSGDTYINKLRTTIDALSTRVTWKPFRWMENSFKYVASKNMYHIQVLGLSTSKMPSEEQNIAYNLALMPNDQWMIDGSYTRKMPRTGPIGASHVFVPPVFTANVDTYTVSASYAPTEKFSIFNSFEYSRAKNKTNVDSRDLTTYPTPNGPLLWGVNEKWYNFETGITWKVKKDLTVEPHYAYQSFRSYPGIESGNYSAQVTWVDVKVAW